MASAIQVKVIKPKAMNVNVFRRAVDKSLDEGAKVIDKSFAGTMTTFKRKFPIVVKKGKSKRIIWVDSDIYFYVSAGTRIRWALMSSDWKSKTRPGRLKPGSGGGRVVVAGRRYMQRKGIPPRPGIRARNFDKQIVKRDGPKIQKLFDRNIAQAARQAY